MERDRARRGFTSPLRTGMVFTLLAALLTLMAPAAQADYPECQAEIRVSDTKVKVGQKITVTAHCQQDLRWTATFDGKSKVGTGRDFTATFVATLNRSARTVVKQLRVVGVFRDPSLGNDTCEHTFDIEISSRDNSAGNPNANDPDDGQLPNTGGPRVALLGLAVLLLLAGIVSIRRARRTEDV